MDSQQKMVLVVTALLVVLAVYFVLETPAPVEEEEEVLDTTTQSLNLVLMGLEMGRGEDNYLYSYDEISDGYTISYSLRKNGDTSEIEITTPISTKKVFFLENGTILCMEDKCSSVHGNDELDNYLRSLEVKFFDDQRIENQKTDFGLLRANNYLSFQKEPEDKGECIEVAYRLDYRTVTLAEAARFGIGATSPKIFDYTMCIDNETGNILQKRFNYTDGGMEHVKEYLVTAFEPGNAGEIEIPENLTADIIEDFREEQEKSINVRLCIVEKEGEERDKCISDLAVRSRDIELCRLAGERTDRCMVSLVPLLKDETICLDIADSGYKDDCYTELAGISKDQSYCNNIQNASKVEYCQQISVPEEEEDTGDSSAEIEELLRQIEEDEPEANETE